MTGLTAQAVNCLVQLEQRDLAVESKENDHEPRHYATIGALVLAIGVPRHDTTRPSWRAVYSRNETGYVFRVFFSLFGIHVG